MQFYFKLGGQQSVLYSNLETTTLQGNCFPKSMNLQLRFIVKAEDKLSWANNNEKIN